ncbi:MAG: hypothetical protein SFX73_38295 [Kofleriaceae bacterium]|nr:hypothetical protein [Kofleriaceae bacterium]
MAHVFSTVSRGYLLAGAVVATGLYATRDHAATEREEPAVASTGRASTFVAPTPAPMLVSTRDAHPDVPELALADEEPEEVRGHGEIEDVAEFAMLFEVGGTTYLRLSSDLRATSRGTPRLIVDGEVYAAVAPVALAALPAELSPWQGRTVLVDGTCKARVVGFAEVARASGDAPGIEEYWNLSEDERPASPPAWTLEDLMNDEVILAAKLDGCAGTWARSTDYQPAQVARAVSSPSLETDAIADLLAIDDGADPIQDAWKEMGGEGDWRESVDIEAKTFEHPDTGEKWIFASAYKEGSCGDPSASKMAAYRVTASGAVQRFTELDYAGETLQEVVDLDGDGQPELVFGSGGSATLVDLANKEHASIAVPFHTYGCGC